MALWSHNLFLQALGWATLNSIWQMGVLWLLFKALQHLSALSSDRKYHIALASLGFGVAWFVATFTSYYNSGTSGTITATSSSMAPTSDAWSLILSSASITYLILLLFPAYRLVQSYLYIGKLKSKGLNKAELHYRLFVQKVAMRLGIPKKVEVYGSSLINSPVTIGYIKPIILLPVAALNSLTLQQTEAILLHELAHIRRSDFLINLIVNVIHTILYYNPFVRFFVADIDAEREKCCDETVIQFEYDKISYATALLTLEKNATALAIAAAGKNHLLKRIEKIVGMEKKTTFSFTHFAGLMGTLLLIILINSLFFVSKPVERNKNLALAAFENPFYAIDRGDRILTAPALKAEKEAKTPLLAKTNEPQQVKSAEKHTIKHSKSETGILAMDFIETPPHPDVISASFNLVEANAAAEEKNHVAKTVEATKKVLAQSQWEAVEKEIADAMSAQEKALAKQEYMAELEKVNWKGLEEKLKNQYKQLDWEQINQNLNSALIDLKLDSLQQVYSSILVEIEKAETEMALNGKVILALPDASQSDVKALKMQLRNRIDSVKLMRNKEVISL